MKDPEITRTTGDAPAPDGATKTRARGVRDSKGRFVPGASPNPGGRPKITADEIEVRVLARRHGARAIARLSELLESKDGRIAVAAAAAVLDRAYGKPSQEIDLKAAAPPANTEVIATNLQECAAAYLQFIRGEVASVRYEPAPAALAAPDEIEAMTTQTSASPSAAPAPSPSRTREARSDAAAEVRVSPTSAPPGPRASRRSEEPVEVLVQAVDLNGHNVFTTAEQAERWLAMREERAAAQVQRRLEHQRQNEDEAAREREARRVREERERQEAARPGYL